jgi:hypothetical protein
MNKKPGMYIIQKRNMSYTWSVIHKTGGISVNETIDYKPYIESDYKVYVDVSEVRLKDGRLFPISFVWEDGNRYDIDKIVDVRQAASLKTGDMGMRYTVRIRNQNSYMFYEEDDGASKWFMERKNI